MKYKFKRAANAVRRLFNASPTIVTTSEGDGKAINTSPILQKASKGRWGGPLMVDVKEYYVARSVSRKHTRDSLWNIDLVMDGYTVESVKAGVSFNRMAAYMKNKELGIARQAGFRGTDEKIIERRRNAVPQSNILNLEQP